jgi:hypothetical protein
VYQHITSASIAKEGFVKYCVVEMSRGAVACVGSGGASLRGVRDRIFTFRQSIALSCD